MSDGRELSWDDVIENDSAGGGFTLLPAGEYPFRVIGFERGRFSGSEKLPPCNKAVVEIEVDGGKLGTTTMQENLFLHSKTEGILCSFFRSIGQRKSGEKLTMNWGAVVGSTGRVKLGVRQWKKKDGTPAESNQVKTWLDPVEADVGFEAGAF
jgi:hypothetical protein